MPNHLNNAITWNFGLVGKNISYSLSPFLHENTENLTSNQNARYQIFDIASEQALFNFLDDFCQNPLAIGLNVTTPYKESVARYFNCQERSVNTIYRNSKNTFSACSTDMTGFEKSLMNLDDFSFLKISHIHFLGAGGSVTCLLEWIKQNLNKLFPNLQSIAIFRRSNTKDHKLVESGPDLPISFYGFCPKLFEARSAKITTQQTLTIQASSAPHQGERMHNWLPAFKNYQGYFADLCYAPQSAIADSMAVNRRFCSGKEVLVKQGLESQKLWFGKQACLKQTLKRLNSILESR